jgi:hypothetical protein
VSGCFAMRGPPCFLVQCGVFSFFRLDVLGIANLT